MSVDEIKKNQREIMSNLFTKIFMSLLTKNHQEIRSYLFNENIYVSIDKKINKK